MKLKHLHQCFVTFQWYHMKNTGFFQEACWVTISSSSFSSSSSASSSPTISWACTVADHKEDKAQSFWTLELRGEWVDIPWASSAYLISLFSFVFISLGGCVCLHSVCIISFDLHSNLVREVYCYPHFMAKGTDVCNLFEVILTRICVFTTMHFIPFLLSLITLSPLLNWS